MSPALSSCACLESHFSARGAGLRAQELGCWPLGPSWPRPHQHPEEPSGPGARAPEPPSPLRLTRGVCGHPPAFCPCPTRHPDRGQHPRCSRRSQAQTLTAAEWSGGRRGAVRGKCDPAGRASRPPRLGSLVQGPGRLPWACAREAGLPAAQRGPQPFGGEEHRRLCLLPRPRWRGTCPPRPPAAPSGRRAPPRRPRAPGGPRGGQSSRMKDTVRWHRPGPSAGGRDVATETSCVTAAACDRANVTS